MRLKLAIVQRRSKLAVKLLAACAGASDAGRCQGVNGASRGAVSSLTASPQADKACCTTPTQSAASCAWPCPSRCPGALRWFMQALLLPRRMGLQPTHSACRARVRATYHRRRSSRRRSRSASARSSSSKSSAQLRWPPSPSRCSTRVPLRSTRRRLCANGRHTTGYSRPLLLWMVMTCTSASSLSRRTTCSSASWPCPASATACASQRIRACSPSSVWLACCNNSARCSTLVRRRSPSGSLRQRAASCKRCSDWRSMASTPCACQTWRNSRICCACASSAVSSLARRCSSARLRPTVRVPRAARTARKSCGMATPCSHRHRSAASSLANTESRSDK